MNRHSRISLSIVFCFAAAFSWSGCAQQDRGNVATSRTGDRANRDDSTYAYHYPSTAPVLDVAELKRFVAQHRGQVVVLQFWASWSSRGREEIARLARLHDEHRSDGLRVIACTFDEPREWRTRTIPVLHAEGANFPCVVIQPGDRQSVADWLDSRWSSDIPAQFIVNREGDTFARSRGEEMILAALNTGGSRRATPDVAPRPSMPRTYDDSRYAYSTKTSRRRSSLDTSAPRPRDASERRLAVARTSTRGDATPEPRVSSTRYTARRSSDGATARDSDRRESTAARSTRTTAPRRRYERSRSTTYESRRVTNRSSTVRPASPVRTVASSSSVGPASVRVRLIDLRSGESEWLPVVSRDAGVDAAVDALVGRVRGRLSPRDNPRIAVLPLTSMRNRDDATPLGVETAESIVADLRRAGYDGLVIPAQTERALRGAGLTQTMVDADPSRARGVIEADYLLMGWVRNDVDEYIDARRTVIAGADGIDSGYVPRRREAEEVGAD